MTSSHPEDRIRLSIELALTAKDSEPSHERYDQAGLATNLVVHHRFGLAPKCRDRPKADLDW